MTAQTTLSATTRGKRGEIRSARTRAASVRSSRRLPFAQGHRRKPVPYSDRSFPPSQLEGRGFHAFRVPTSPSGIPSIKSRRFSSIPLAQPYPRNPSPCLDRNEFTPLALTHPRNPSAIQGARKLVLQIKSHSPRVTDFPWPPWPARRGRPARRFGRLIANARLKFSLSHRKISLLKISNRERIAIFQLTFQHRKSWPYPNRQAWLMRALVPRFTIHESQVTSHDLLIDGSAIRNRRKALKT
jgi:hypothetical protein